MLEMSFVDLQSFQREYISFEQCFGFYSFRHENGHKTIFYQISIYTSEKFKLIN